MEEATAARALVDLRLVQRTTMVMLTMVVRGNRRGGGRVARSIRSGGVWCKLACLENGVMSNMMEFARMPE